MRSADDASRQLTELDAQPRPGTRAIDPSRELGDPVERPARADLKIRLEAPALFIRRRHDPAPRRLYLGDTLAHLRLQARVRDC